ncbi:fimbrillin family protein [Prevotella sp. AGR2160]|uniref:fimbrillin family protein n=1 Tax=Prevotella sp. AGR2160 TaxID=1280674 RepID=UPI000418355C|nr:fimbrillin family protein [Prevotella sp. AGR2160]
MRKNKFFPSCCAALLPLMLLLPAACAGGDGGADTGEATEAAGTVPIVIRAVIGTSSRAPQEELQETRLAFGQNLWVWVDKAKDGKAYIGAWEHLSNGDGTFVTVNPGIRYFPNGNRSINVYAVHAKTDLKEGDSRPKKLLHHCYNLQTTDENYLQSDLLWGDSLPVAAGKSGDGVKLKLHHMLSKLRFCFQPVGSVTAQTLEGAKVAVTNVYTNCTLDPETGAGTTYGEQGEIQFPLKQIDASATTFDGATYGYCVVPPQLITPRRLVTMTLKDGTTFYYRPDSTFSFDPGKTYTFNLQVKQTIKVDPGELDTLTNHDEQIVFDLEPIVATPFEVTDWNAESFDIVWTQLIAEPGDPDIEEWKYDSHSQTWTFIQDALDVDDWIPQNGGTKNYDKTDVDK